MHQHDDDPEAWLLALWRFLDEGYETPEPRATASDAEPATRWDER